MKTDVDLEALPSLSEGQLAGVQGGFVISGVLATELKASSSFLGDLRRRLPKLRAPWTPIPPVTSLIA
jgi:hypothetical protein